MDYSNFYANPYPAPPTAQPLSRANLQALNGTAFPQNPSPQPNQQTQPNGMAQLQQNMFYLDPFDTKMDQSECPAEVDASVSFANGHDSFLEELDDLARVGARPATQVANPSTKRNESPQGLNLPLMSSASEIDFGDFGPDFLDATGGNSSKRKAQNRAAQRAFRERKERHVKELEAKVAALENVRQKSADETARLKEQLQKLESENNALKGANITFTFPQFEKTNGNYSPPLSDHGSFSDGQPQIDAPMFDEDPFLPKPISPVSLPSPPKPSTQTVTTRVNNLMQQYHDYTLQNPSQTVVARAPEDGHNYFDCPKVWERIVTHPRFDEVDVESLCAALNSKVKIVTETAGPSVSADQLEMALDEAIDEVVRRHN